MTDKRRVLVVGAEHSGVRWIWALVSRHPQIEARVVSFPSQGQWPTLQNPVKGLDFGEGDFLLHVCRDRSCVRKAHEKESSYYPKMVDKYGDCVVTAANYAIEIYRPMHLHKLFVSYETMIQCRYDYLLQIFMSMGLHMLEYPYDDVDVQGPWFTVNTAPKDGNAKYITP
jgi:hypothetical protein